MIDRLPVFFLQVLGLVEPWYISDVEVRGLEIHIRVDFKRGAKFPYKGELCRVHDTVIREWRHMNLFQYKTYLHARVPRIYTPEGVKQVQVPWAREGSGFTLFFEALLLSLAQLTSVAQVHQLCDVSDNRIWRVLEHYIEKEVKFQDFSEEPVTTLSIDEVARKKGHVYLTSFMDLERAKVVHVSDGKGKESIFSFKERYEEKEGKVDDIETVVMDLSPAFISAIEEAFPKATIVFDKFHVVKLLNNVLDSIRRRERKENIPRFNKIRYLLLKDPKKLKKSQRERLDEFLTQANLDTVKAYNLIQMFKRGYEYQKPSWAGKFFHHWIKLCQQSKIPEMLKGAQAILTHLKGIMAYFTYRVTNAVMEGNNSKLRTITKRSYGFKTLRYLRLMIFLVFGKLRFDVPRLT